MPIKVHVGIFPNTQNDNTAHIKKHSDMFRKSLSLIFDIDVTKNAYCNIHQIIDNIGQTVVPK